MIKIILTRGAPASGKSTWAKAEVTKDPTNYLRINNDDLRESFNGTVFSDDYEKIIRATRLFLIKEGIKAEKNIIIDNVNASKRNWDDIVKIASEANKDIMVMTKPFYEELDILLERNSKREGQAKVPDDVIKKFWKQLGGKQFKFESPKVEIFKKRDRAVNIKFTPMIQDESKPATLICDMDGTFAIIGDRSPYDASNCDKVDFPNWPVIDTVNMYYAMGLGYKVIFCSGREDKDEAPTRRFIEKYFAGGSKYELFMRKTGDNRSDDIVKEEIFNENIRNKYLIKLVLDDRSRVVSQWRKMGLVCFQVADGDF